MRSIASNPNEGSVGFQIAPMIDVVFVIMLFFMVMAGAVKTEKELNTTLPGSADNATNATEFVDEQIITISDAGEIMLNDEPFDSATSRELPQLKATLMRLKQNADSTKTPAVVTIISDPEAKYSRTVDVLDALAVAQISNVTFTVNEEE